MQGGEAAMVELLGRNLNLSAVFAYNDGMAAGALTALKDNGIQVLCHRLNPPFTALRHIFDRMTGTKVANAAMPLL